MEFINSKSIYHISRDRERLALFGSVSPVRFIPLLWLFSAGLCVWSFLLSYFLRGRGRILGLLLSFLPARAWEEQEENAGTLSKSNSLRTTEDVKERKEK